MLEVDADIFELMHEVDAICVTTNGVVKSNGNLVMGAGLALSFKNRWPDLPAELGKWVKLMGNVPCVIAKPLGVTSAGTFPASVKTIFIISYPTKNHYREESDLHLIYHSAYGIVKWADKLKLSKIALTRPGCGMGRRSWEHEVRPILTNIFDDRFIVVS